MTIPTRRPSQEGLAGPVTNGETRRFLSTLQDTDGDGILVRKYTDQVVTVVRELVGAGLDAEETGGEPERMFLVRASDGVEFAAWEYELQYGGSNIYVLPSGEYVANPEWEHDPF